jgi:cytidylate kinase
MTGNPSKHIVIAIDGPAGAGKSTAAKRLAQMLDCRYINSGAMYRAAGWVAHAQHVAFDDEVAVAALLGRVSIEFAFSDGQTEVWVDGCHITSQLRGESVGKAASAVAILPAVRDVITKKLRDLSSPAALVMEGRDIGTVVFPDATCKFYLEASLDTRAQRRFQEMRQAGQSITLGQIRQAIATRDTQDQGRSVAPLNKALDAHVIDTTDLTVDGVVKIMLSGVRKQTLQRNM